MEQLTQALEHQAVTIFSYFCVMLVATIYGSIGASLRSPDRTKWRCVSYGFAVSSPALFAAGCVDWYFSGVSVLFFLLPLPVTWAGEAIFSELEATTIAFFRKYVLGWLRLTQDDLNDTRDN